MRRLNNHQDGIVSMVAVIVVSILLSIIALGLLRLTLDEQRGSTDLMLSTKAYYAAEAGIEDALFSIKTLGIDGVTKDSCDQGDVEPSISEYTCQLIQSGQSSKTGAVTPNEAYQLDMRGTNNLSQLRLQWHQQGVDNPRNGLDSFTDGNNPQTTQDSPPILRVEVVKVPSGEFDRDSLTSNRQVLYLRPSLIGGVSTAALSFGSPYGSATISAANCPNTPGAGYACNVTLTGFTGGDYFLRLSTLYAQGNANFLLTALDGSGNTSDQAFFGSAIDVTAKANNVFRRIRYEIPSGSETSLLPFALLGGESLCFDAEVHLTNNTVTKGGEDACSTTPL